MHTDVPCAGYTLSSFIENTYYNARATVSVEGC